MTVLAVARSEGEQEGRRGGGTGIERMGGGDVRVGHRRVCLSGDGSSWYFDHVRAVMVSLGDWVRKFD